MLKKSPGFLSAQNGMSELFLMSAKPQMLLSKSFDIGNLLDINIIGRGYFYPRYTNVKDL